MVVYLDSRLVDVMVAMKDAMKDKKKVGPKDGYLAVVRVDLMVAWMVERMDKKLDD